MREAAGSTRVVSTSNATATPNGSSRKRCEELSTFVTWEKEPIGRPERRASAASSNVCPVLQRTFGIPHLRLDRWVLRDGLRSDLFDTRQRLVGKFGHPSEPVFGDVSQTCGGG